MTFRMNTPMTDEIHEFLGTQHNSLWPPLTTNGRDNITLHFEAPSASYRATQIVPDIQHMLDTFPDLILNGTQDFTTPDGDFYRLVITNNEINLLEGHVVYT